MSENVAENMDQLTDYREAQRRRFEAAKQSQVDSQGSYTTEENETEAQPSTITSQPVAPGISKQATSLPIPSAPPQSELQTQSEKQQIARDEDFARSIQEQEDFARRIQEQEDERLAQHTREEQQASYPNIEQETQMAEDEHLARLLQDAPASPRDEEEGQQTHTQPQQQPPQPEETGWFASIGRGIRNAYNLYQQYAAQQAMQQLNQDQISRDASLARQLQSQEMGRPVFEVRSPHMGRRANYPHFYNNYEEDFDDEDDIFQSPRPIQQESPLSRLREVNSVFRSMGVPPEHPLFRHMQEMMHQPQAHGQIGGQHVFFFPRNMPAHRYQYPRSVLQVRGIEDLPPELYQMVQGESDTSYESLLQLAERIQPVSRGASNEQIEQLPTRLYKEGSMPADEAKCGVCLADYEKDEELRTLPGCLHAFHKECIDKWLQINKICPVCRHDITPGSS